MRWPLRANDDNADRRARQRLIEDLTGSIGFVTDVASLRARVAEHIRGIALCEIVVFCGYNAPEAAYVTVAVDGEALERWTKVVLSGGGSLVRWLRINGEVLRLPDERGAESFIDPAERRMLESLNVRGCVPLIWLNQLVGILLLSSTTSDWRVSRQLAELLSDCGRHIAMACEAAERREEELERIRLAGRAQQLAVAGQLAASVAHEVRNPLTAIRSTLQFVLNSSQPWSETRPLVADLVQEVDRIQRTISGILTLSRPADLVREPVDLCDLIAESQRLLEPYAEGQNVTIEVPSDPGTLPVTGDGRELRQVFVNLLFNACQAMPAGGRITIQHKMVHRSASAGGAGLAAMVQIQDTGPGMTDAILARVFDPFFTTKSSGTGLGLPICLEIVTRHGGELRLASEVGRGTVATVLIPLREAS
jgi:signal transduction histidine kinase